MWLPPSFRDQLADNRDQVAWDRHHCLRGANRCLILKQSIALGLLLVVAEHSLDLVFGPSVGKSCFAHCCFFFLRFRNAASEVRSETILSSSLSVKIQIDEQPRG